MFVYVAFAANDHIKV